MNYKSIFILLFTITLMCYGKVSNANNDNIDSIKNNDGNFPEIQVLSSSTLDEWKNPGKYSALNVLNDDDKIWATKIDLNKNKSAFIYFHFENQFSITEGVVTSGKRIQLDSIDSIKIKNGYNKSKSSYFNNVRAKTIEVYIHSADNQSYKVEPKIYTLNDDFNTYQNIDLKDSDNKNVVGILISFKDYYPGEKYNDLCISHIEFIKNNKVLKFKNSNYLFVRDSKDTYKNKFLEFINAPGTNFAEMTDELKENHNLLIIDKEHFYLNTIKSDEVVPNEKGYIKKIKYKFDDDKLFLYINNIWKITNYQCVIEDTTWEIPLFLNRYKAVIFNNTFLNGKFYIDEYSEDDPKKFSGIINLFKETKGFY